MTAKIANKLLTAVTPPLKKLKRRIFASFYACKSVKAGKSAPIRAFTYWYVNQGKILSKQKNGASRKYLHLKV